MAQKALPHLKIELFDSGTAAGGESLLVLAASQGIQQGLSLAELTGLVNRVAPGIRVVAFLDTLHYLAKGGRIPKMAAWAVSILNIKPVMELYHGEVHLVARPRSRSKATQRLLGILRKEAGPNPVHVNVMHANVPQEAEALKVRAAREFRCRTLLVSEFTPAMVVHTGPGLLGFAFYVE